MKLALAMSSGKQSIDVSDTAFGREFNESLVHQVVVRHLAGQRQGTKGQKNRSAVSGGGAKPWRQKGTGRARAGTIRSPIFRSGGRTFAAETRSYLQKINKKMYRAALQAILSELVRQQRLLVVDEFNVEQPKTKLLVNKIKEFNLDTDKVLIVVNKLEDNLYLAARNLPNIVVLAASCINPVQLIKHEKVIMTVDAIRAIEEAIG